jgi:hypothetical protein
MPYNIFIILVQVSFIYNFYIMFKWENSRIEYILDFQPAYIMINMIQDINTIFWEADNEKYPMGPMIHISDILVYRNKNFKVLKIQRILTPQRTTET